MLPQYIEQLTNVLNYCSQRISKKKNSSIKEKRNYVIDKRQHSLKKQLEFNDNLNKIFEENSTSFIKDKLNHIMLINAFIKSDNVN